MTCCCEGRWQTVILAPEPLVRELVSEAANLGTEPGLLVDGFPRHPDQLPLVEELFENWAVIHVDVPTAIAISRLQNRRVCKFCGTVMPACLNASIPSCSTCGNSKWCVRIEDDEKTIYRRLGESERRLKQLLNSLARRESFSLMAGSPLTGCAIVPSVD